ncbi:MAG: hypothetical protein WDN10_04225 [bacterium]
MPYFLRPVLLALALGFMLAPSLTLAAAKPAVSLTAPLKGASYSRTEKMPVSWSVSNVSHDVVVVGEVKLVKQDRSAPSAGLVGGGTFMHVVHPSDTGGTHVWDWGANDSIPGKYSVTLRLYECAAKGCDYFPTGKAVSKKTKTVSFTVLNTGTGAPAASATHVTILSPNGNERYQAGSGKKLTIRWTADGVLKGSTVCTELIQQSTQRYFSFPGDDSCKRVKDGKGSVGGPLIRTSGYDLSPGKYWASVRILAPKTSDGKDSATLASDTSDDTFSL